MIDIKGLRIGNKVSYQLNLYTVTGIDPNQVYVYLRDGNNDQHISAKPKYIEPIPLDEKDFFDFGFKKIIGFSIGIYPDANLELGYNNDKSYPQWYCFIRNILYDGNIDEFCIFRKDLKYIHELQNLYFGLTGQELINSNEHQNP